MIDIVFLNLLGFHFWSFFCLRLRRCFWQDQKLNGSKKNFREENKCCYYIHSERLCGKCLQSISPSFSFLFLFSFPPFILFIFYWFFFVCFSKKILLPLERMFKDIPMLGRIFSMLTIIVFLLSPFPFPLQTSFPLPTKKIIFFLFFIQNYYQWYFWISGQFILICRRCNYWLLVQVVTSTSVVSPQIRHFFSPPFPLNFKSKRIFFYKKNFFM